MATTAKKIFIVIPAFNEEKTLSKVIKSIKRKGFENLIVIDDGSFDKTSDLAKKTGAIVLRHIINRGFGAAVKTGLEAARILDADCVITFDADGQHSPDDIKKLVDKVNKGFDVILGTRRLDQEGRPPIRIMSNFIGNILTWLVYGLWVNDSQSGLRAFSKKAINYFDTKSDRYEFASEVIREIARHKLKYIEVPIKVFYTKYSLTKKDRQNFTNSLKTIYRLIFSP